MLAVVMVAAMLLGGGITTYASSSMRVMPVGVSNLSGGTVINPDSNGNDVAFIRRILLDNKDDMHPERFTLGQSAQRITVTLTTNIHPNNIFLIELHEVLDELTDATKLIGSRSTSGMGIHGGHGFVGPFAPGVYEVVIRHHDFSTGVANAVNLSIHPTNRTTNFANDPGMQIRPIGASFTTTNQAVTVRQRADTRFPWSVDVTVVQHRMSMLTGDRYYVMIRNQHQFMSTTRAEADSTANWHRNNGNWQNFGSNPTISHTITNPLR